MKNLTKIFVVFALIILFAGSAYAQYNIPDPPESEGPGSRCVSPDPDLAHSPSEACQLWERVIYCTYTAFVWKISELGDGCTITSGYIQNGTYHYYYSGDQYCRERFGSSFKNYKTCTLRTDIAQPTPIPKLEPAPGFQPLLEKSATQLEIERKAAENNIPPKKKPVPPERDDADPQPPEPGDPLYGSPTILRDGKSVSFGTGSYINPGDVVLTGDANTVQLMSDSGAIIINRGDTRVEFLGLRDTKVESQPWPTAEDAKEEMISFLKNCSSSDYSACKGYIATVVMRGDVFFSEKMREKFPDDMRATISEKYPHGLIATLTAIMKSVGTEYGVTVAPDGATTVTTLEGSVLVMDVKSKQSILVGANQSITIPKSTKGLTEAELQQSLIQIDPSSIDKWWEKKTQEQIAEGFRYFMIGSLTIFIVVMILILIFKKVKKIIINRKK